MRFTLVDRILEWQPGKSLRAVKYLTAAEEYLADHFPSFPVMPGVMMLESLVESAAWLWRVTSDFQHSVIVLRESRNVKYGTFMEPGKKMVVTIDWVKQEADRVTFKGKGVNQEGASTVNAQFTLHGYNVRDRHPEGGAVDEKLIRHWKERFVLLSSIAHGKSV
jgi:3-hydroxyacyl-[acyl-carrier-protein] dehydratase